MDTRSDAQLHSGRGKTLRMQRFQPFELIETVDDDLAHAGAHRLPEFLGRLVVAVQNAAVGRHTRVQDSVELASRGDIEQEALLDRQAGHRPAQEGFRRVDDVARPELRDGPAAVVAEMLLVVDEERGPVLRRERRHGHAADRQLTGPGDGGSLRQQPHVDGTHICSGAPMPRRPRPHSMTRAVMSEM